MAQRKQLTWAELRVGVFVLAGLIILMIAIFYVTGASFLGPKYKLITYLPEVDGLNTGAPGLASTASSHRQRAVDHIDAAPPHPRSEHHAGVADRQQVQGSDSG